MAQQQTSTPQPQSSNNSTEDDGYIINRRLQQLKSYLPSLETVYNKYDLADPESKLAFIIDVLKEKRKPNLILLNKCEDAILEIMVRINDKKNTKCEKKFIFV